MNQARESKQVRILDIILHNTNQRRVEIGIKFKHKSSFLSVENPKQKVSQVLVESEDDDGIEGRM